VAAGLIFIFICYFIINGKDISTDVAKFRSKPSYSGFLRAFNENSVAGYLKRYLLIQGGSDVYNSDIHNYILKAAVSDDWVNERLYRKHFLSLDKELFVADVKYYPYDKAAFSDYVDFQLFGKACSFFDISEGVWLGERGKELLWLSRRGGYFECLEKKLNSDFLYLIDDVALNSIDMGTKYSMDFITLFDDFSYSNSNVIVAAKFTNSPVLIERELARKYLYKNLLNIDYRDVYQNILGGEFKGENIDFIEKLFEISIMNGYGDAIDFFHKIVDKDVLVGEYISKNILLGEDSSLRKGVIVLLIRHGSLVGGEYIDQAYKGSAPRLELFKNGFSYLYGSSAVEQYTYIARHDYRETGKHFPPIYCKPPLDNEIELWEQFIDEYPWFPGTDDAYYRLAFRYYAEQKIGDSLRIIDEFYNRSFTDSDAETLIFKLKEKISLMNNLKGKGSIKASELYNAGSCKKMGSK